MKFYVIGEDKSLKDVTEDVLALAGGYMSGNIGFQGNSGNIDIIKFVKGDSTGDGISIGQNGIVVIGAGESVNYYTPASGGGNTEKLILASDTTIEFYVNAQNGATNAKQVIMSTAGLLSGHQKAITSGTAAPSGGSNGDIYIQY